MKIYQKAIKPFFDFILATILLVILSPIMVFIILLLFFFNNGNVFFTQKRIGYQNKDFTIYKFKTMDENIQKPDNERLTKIGFYLRKFSFDELPQLINIIKGNMSFVGPRPLLVEYLPLYNEEQIKRHNVKPGITGLAQINGRNCTTWDKRFEYDCEYVSEITVFLDLKIMIFTSFQLFSKPNGEVLIKKFKGNN